MLQHAGIKPPTSSWTLLRGLVMRRYALLYPEDVASVLLVDPCAVKNAAMDRPSSPSSIAARSYRAMRFQLRLRSPLAVTSCFAGRPHFKSARRCAGRRTSCAGRVTDEVARCPASLAHRRRTLVGPSYYVGMSDHVEAVPDTVREMKDAEPIRGIPVTVLTPGKSTRCLKNARTNRDNVQQVIAPASAHWITRRARSGDHSIREMVAAVSTKP